MYNFVEKGVVKAYAFSYTFYQRAITLKEPDCVAGYFKSMRCFLDHTQEGYYVHYR